MLIVLTSCFEQKDLILSFDIDKIEEIKLFKGFPGEEIILKNDIKNKLIKDLNKSKSVGPTKYMKTHRFLIYYKESRIDTIYTNGIIHNFGGWFKSRNNLLKKYIQS